MALSSSDSIRCHGLLLMAALCVAVASCDRPPATSDEAKPISFGQRQVDQLIADRPDMAGVLSEDDPVMKWIIDSFNGDRIGQRVYWNANSPQSGSEAEHGPPNGGYPAYVSLSGGAETTPVDKWASVVYELFNLENTQAFEELNDRAMAGEVDGDTYALECVRLEFVAVVKTKAFFEKHTLPASVHGNDPWYNWVLGDIGTFEENVQGFRENYTGLGYNPLRYFRDGYDSEIAPYVEWQREKEKNPHEDEE